MGFGILAVGVDPNPPAIQMLNECGYRPCGLQCLCVRYFLVLTHARDAFTLYLFCKTVAVYYQYVLSFYSAGQQVFTASGIDMLQVSGAQNPSFMLTFKSCLHKLHVNICCEVQPWLLSGPEP